LYRSSAAENGDAATEGNIPGKTDSDLAAFHNHGYLPLASRQSKHFLQFLGIFIHFHVNSAIPIGCPSLITEGSGVRSVNDDLFFHQSLLRIESQASAGKNFLLKYRATLTRMIRTGTSIKGPMTVAKA